MDEVKLKVCDFKSLYTAMYKCKKNVMWKDSVAGWVKNGLANCHRLNKQLMDDTYTIDKYSEFIIHEPKTREIVSTRFKDRVFQRSLCDNYLYEAVTKSFIFDNCACQVGKGTDFARRRLLIHMQRFFRKHGTDGYVLNCDIKSYFGSTPHSTAKAAMRKRIDNDWAYGHVGSIIDSYNQGPDPDVGMGLGSQITQLVQLAVLDDLDHYIKEGLQIKQYVRYMDDFILIHHDKEYLHYCKKKIGEQLANLGLQLNLRKTQIFSLKQGINFLGFKFHLTETGKVIRRLHKSNVTKARRRLKKLKALVDRGVLTRKDVDECFTSWKAHAKKGNTYGLIKSMNRFYDDLWRDGIV